MKRIAVLAAAAILAGCGTSATDITERPPTQAYPFIGKLSYDYQGDPHWPGCGATLVARSWILTAAHCFELGGRPRADQMQLRVGSVDRLSGGATARGERWAHPGFTTNPPAHDIALLKLATPIDGYRPVEIAASPPQANAPVRLVAWRGETGPTTSTTLTEIHTTVTDASKCAGLEIGRNELCIDSRDGIGACHGDSGAPEVTDGPNGQVVVGVGSRMERGEHR